MITGVFGFAGRQRQTLLAARMLQTPGCARIMRMRCLATNGPTSGVTNSRADGITPGVTMYGLLQSGQTIGASRYFSAMPCGTRIQADYRSILEYSLWDRQGNMVFPAINQQLCDDAHAG